MPEIMSISSKARDLKVVDLEQAKQEPQEDVVAILKEALKEAEAGELRSVLIVGCDRTGEPSKGFAGDLVLSRAIGLLETLKFEILRNNEFWEGE